MDKEKMLYQQDNRVLDQRDTLQRLSRNIMGLLTRELQKKYPIIKQKDGKTILHAYDKSKIEDEVVTITDEHLKTITGHNEKNPAKNITYFKHLLKQLRAAECLMPVNYRDNKWIVVGWINYAERDDEKKCFEVQISKKVIPYLLNLASNYTSIDLLCQIEIKNIYALKLYQKCCQYKRTGWFEWSEDEIRETLCVYKIDKTTGKRLKPLYTNSSQFRAKVLEVAKKELKSLFDRNLIDCYFDYLPTSWLHGKQHPCKWVFAIGWKGHEPDFKKSVLDKQKWIEEKKQVGSQRDLFADYYSSSPNMAVQGISVMIKTYFPKEKKLLDDVVNVLTNKPEEFATKILNRISKMRKKYDVDSFPPCFRTMLNQDVLGLG